MNTAIKIVEACFSISGLTVAKTEHKAIVLQDIVSFTECLLDRIERKGLHKSSCQKKKRKRTPPSKEFELCAVSLGDNNQANNTRVNRK